LLPPAIAVSTFFSEVRIRDVRVRLMRVRFFVCLMRFLAEG